MSNIPIFTNALKMTLYSEIVWHISDILQYVLQVTTESQQQIDEEAARWKEKTFERFLRAEKKNEISWELFLDAPSMRIFPPFNRWLFHYQNKKNRSMYGNNSPLWVMNKNIRISMRYFFTGWKRAETFEHPHHPPPPPWSNSQKKVWRSSRPNLIQTVLLRLCQLDQYQNCFYFYAFHLDWIAQFMTESFSKRERFLDLIWCLDKT